jgi:hypothetical protein
MRKKITAGAIEADLVYIDQAKHEVGMLLNPGGGLYMTFECGGESVEAIGRFQGRHRGGNRKPSSARTKPPRRRRRSAGKRESN